VTKRILVTPLAKADETVRFVHGRADIAHSSAGTVTRWILEPGWRWSSPRRLAAGARAVSDASSRVPRLGTNGHLYGRTMRLDAGDAFAILPDHDGWVEGDEPCVRIDVVAARRI